MNLLLVFVGGGIGASLRYLVALWIDQAVSSQDSSGEGFPFATLAVNVAGSLLLGILAGLSSGESGPLANHSWRLLIAVGVLGGFTTFSTFSLETVRLWSSGDVLSAVWFVIANLIGCVLMAAIGFGGGRLLA